MPTMGAGRRVRMTDPRGYITTFAFDAAGQDVGRIDPLLRRTSFAYDGAGRRIRKLDPRGSAFVSYAYDAAGQQTGEIQPGGVSIEFRHDLAGRRVLVSDPTGRTTPLTTPPGRFQRVRQPLSKRVSYAYDPAGRRSTLWDPDGRRITHARRRTGNSPNCSARSTDSTSSPTTGAGREVRKTLANGRPRHAGLRRRRSSDRGSYH